MVRVVLILVLFAFLGWSEEPVKTLLLDGQEIIQVTTGLVRYQFARAGGVLRSAYVYFSTYGTNPVETVPGWAGENLVPGASLPFEVWLGERFVPAEYEVLTEETSEGVRVVLSGESGDLRVKKEFVLPPNGLYTGDFSVTAEGEGLVRLVLGHLPGEPKLVYIYDGKVQNAPLAPGSYSRFQGLGLVGKGTVFFFQIEEGEVRPFVGKNAAGQPVFGVEMENALRLRGRFYTGRNRYVLLVDAGLKPLAQSGPFTGLLVGMIRLLEWLYRLTKNYGWAIVLFTLVTRVLLYPLTRSQFRSMAKMQKLAPKIRKLQERFKDDREALQQQLMELYRQEKVNPLGGCLPMLLQFPLLILLWQAIMYSAEKIHLSPGFLWVPDLSQPDPYYLLVVLGTGVQILYTWYTQRRLPEGGGSQFFGYLFPLIMAVLFLHFPAGLWLYWAFTTLVQFGQQVLIDWEMAREEVRQAKPAGSNGGKDS